MSENSFHFPCPSSAASLCRTQEAAANFQFGQERPSKNKMVASQEQGGFFGTNLDRPLPVIPLLASLMILAACSMGNADLSRIDQSQVVAEAEWKAAVREELEGRSFRQFQPSKDGSPRKAVILDFSSGIGL